MSTMQVIKTPSLESYIKVYGSFSQEDQLLACEIASDIVQKIFASHLETIKGFRNLDDAASHFLAYVSEAMEDKQLAERVDSYGGKLLGRPTLSEFSTAIEWGTIDYLKDRLKNREI